MANVLTLDQYADLDRPEIRYLIEGYIPKPGLILFLGEAGAGKSFMALQIAMAVAQGGKVFDTQASKGNVLYFQFDMSELIVRERIKKLRQAGVNTSGPIYTLHPETAPVTTNILDPACYAHLQDAVDKSNPDLIIFDVLAEMHSVDEDSSSEMKPVGDAIMTLCKGRCGLILHHPRKTTWGIEPKVIDASRGSSYLPGKVDAVWMMHDGYFYIGKSRFSMGAKLKLKRLPSGLWALA